MTGFVGRAAGFGRNETFSQEGIFQGLQDIQAVFSDCGNIAAQAAEPVGAFFTAESAGDFLFQLGHSDIPFAEIIVERNPKRRILIILDILMPFSDGLEATTEILKLDPDAKVIMISALGQNSYLEKALECGAKNFITKPFSPPGVIEILEKVLKE